jgi:serine/threonine protein kinase
MDFPPHLSHFQFFAEVNNVPAIHYPVNPNQNFPPIDKATFSVSQPSPHPHNFPPYLQHYWGISTGQKTYEASYIPYSDHMIQVTQKSIQQAHQQQPLQNIDYGFNTLWIPAPHVYNILRPSEQHSLYSSKQKNGHGVFGTVYKAQENNSKEIVALKEFNPFTPSLFSQTGFPITILREIQTYQILQASSSQPIIAHPNVVQLHKVVHSHKFLTSNDPMAIPYHETPKWWGSISLVFEYVPYTLEQVINASIHQQTAPPPRRPPHHHHQHQQQQQPQQILLNGIAMTPVTQWNLTFEQIQFFTSQLINGLNFCHQNGIIHRDIKPANILVDSTGVIKIADLGLARTIPRNPNLTAQVSTLAYKSPELLLLGEPHHLLYFCSQEKGEKYPQYGFPVDLWAFGCVVIEMMIRKPIFQGRFVIDQLQAIMQLLGPIPLETWSKAHCYPIIRMRNGFNSNLAPLGGNTNVVNAQSNIVGGGVTNAVNNIPTTNINSITNPATNSDETLLSKLNSDQQSIQVVFQAKYECTLVDHISLNVPPHISSAPGFQPLLSKMTAILSYDPKKRPSAWDLFAAFCNAQLRFAQTMQYDEHDLQPTIDQPYFVAIYGHAFENAMRAYLIHESKAFSIDKTNSLLGNNKPLGTGGMNPVRGSSVGGVQQQQQQQQQRGMMDMNQNRARDRGYNQLGNNGAPPPPPPAPAPIEPDYGF